MRVRLCLSHGGDAGMTGHQRSSSRSSATAPLPSRYSWPTRTLRRHRLRAVPHVELAGELGVIITAHCENAEMVANCSNGCWRKARPGQSGTNRGGPRRSKPKDRPSGDFPRADRGHGLRGPHSHEPLARPPAVEAHMRGVRLWVETVVPYLLLDKSDAERAGVEAQKHVMSPPLHRGPARPLGALKAGLIDTVGTDHCPFDTQKNWPWRRPSRRFPTAFRASKTA